MTNKKTDIDTILVPVDFSTDSARAVIHAAEQADQEGLGLIILHVIHDPVDAPGFYAKKSKSKKRLHRMEDVAHEMLDEFLKGLKSGHPKLEALNHARTRLVAGLPVPRILEVVKELKPRSVVMGGRGHSAISRLLLGSKTEQCLRLCPVPVTIVRE